MITEVVLSAWTAPSSDTEKEKQERAERMIRQAIDDHEPFKDCSLKVYAKALMQIIPMFVQIAMSILL